MVGEQSLVVDMVGQKGEWVQQAAAKELNYSNSVENGARNSMLDYPHLQY
jgi:hypothetical protein